MQLIREADNELKKYSEIYPREKVYLIQASEKVWVAFNLLMEKIIGAEINSGDNLKFAVEVFQKFKKDSLMKNTYNLVHTLHIYHYEGRGNPDTIKSYIKKSIKNILVLKRRYKV